MDMQEYYLYQKNNKMIEISSLVEHLAYQVTYKRNKFPDFPIDVYFVNDHFEIKANTIGVPLFPGRLVTFYPGFQHIYTSLHILLENIHLSNKFWNDNPITLN